MKIIQFDRSTCKVLGEAVTKALAAVAAEHGVEIAYAGGTMDGAKFTMKLRCAVTDPAAVEADRKQKFAQFCGLYDLKPHHYGMTFSAGGKQYRLIGFNPSRDKWPVTVQAADKVVLLGRMALDLIRAQAKIA